MSRHDHTEAMHVGTNQTGWECPRCGTINAPATLKCDCAPARRSLRDRTGITWPMTRPTFDPSKCPCQPQNGGSGICGCIMSGPTITCTVTS